MEQNVDNFKGFNELALFAGAGGGILGGRLLGWRTVCAVEIDPYAASVLVARQNDGQLPPFPIWDDVCTFDGRPWRGKIDVISGGFPCQDISCAGKGAGIEGARSGLWAQYARIIREVRPRYAFVENSPMLVSLGLGRVLGDLSEIGYDAAWTVLGADDVGAPHIRKRIWILAKDACEMADADGDRRAENEVWNEVACEAFYAHERGKSCRTDCVRDPLPDAEREWCAKYAREISHADGERLVEGEVVQGGDNCGVWVEEESKGKPHNTDFDRSLCISDAEDEGALRRNGELRGIEEAGKLGRDNDRGTPSYGSREWWASEPGVGRVADGVAHRVDRLRCIGNGQVPLCAATAFRILYKQLSERCRDFKELRRPSGRAKR